MDPVSHALLGAGCAQSRTRPEKLLPAAVVAGLASLAPDLDLLLQSFTDPLRFLELHRQFTHALVFAPFGAALCALAARPAARHRLTFRETYLACLAGFASHGLLDACTSYGTQLLWPFADVRVAWSIVAIVDPAFTFPIAGLVALAIKRARARYAQLAAAWAIVYLAFGAAQHVRAAAAGAEIAAGRGHAPVRLEVKPALGSVMLWKIIYEHDGRYYVDAVRTGLTPRIYPGESIAKLDVPRHFPWLDPRSRQAADIERFRRVSGDFLAPDPAAPNRVVDMRYSMVPNEIAPFWAIVVDPQAEPHEHVSFVTTREASPRHLSRLLDMLFSSP